jgi:hypothetical protein
MTPIEQRDVALFSETEWQRLLLSDRRPNLLIQCVDDQIELVVARLINVCARPLQARTLPGELDLPDEPAGTLLLSGVAQMTLSQQIELYDWISHRDDTQIISVTPVPLASYVKTGRFLEALFYRINMVSLVASVSHNPFDAEAELIHSWPCQAVVARTSPNLCQLRMGFDVKD